MVAIGSPILFGRHLLAHIHDDRSADHFWLPPFRSSSAPRIPMTIGPPIISVVICPSTPIPIMCHLLCIWPKRWLQRSQLLSLHQQHQRSLHQQHQLTTFLSFVASPWRLSSLQLRARIGLATAVGGSFWRRRGRGSGRTSKPRPSSCIHRTPMHGGVVVGSCGQ